MSDQKRLNFFTCPSDSFIPQLLTVDVTPRELGATNQLEQLDDFALLSMFNMMTLEGVLRFADRNDRFRQLIDSYDMIRRFKPDHKWLIINSNESAIENVRVTRNEIILNDIETIHMALRALGSHIERIQFNCHNFSEPEVLAIGQTLNRHCSTSLAAIVLHSPSKNLTNDWTNRFEGVKNISMHLKSASTIAQVHESFPNVEQIELSVEYRSNLNFLMHPMEKLRHLHILDGPSSQIESHPLEVLGFHRQLRSFWFTEIERPQFVEAVNSALPDLESLALTIDVFDPLFQKPSGKMHFPNVTEFLLTVREMSHILQKQSLSFSFDRLERFQFKSGSLPECWMQFISENKALRWISMPLTELTGKQMQRIVEQSPALEEIIIYWSEAQHNEIFGRYFGAESKLKRIGVVLKEADDRDALMTIMLPKWRLVDETVIDNSINWYAKEMHSLLSFEWVG